MPRSRARATTAQAPAAATACEGDCVTPPFCRTRPRPTRAAKRSNPSRGSSRRKRVRRAAAARAPRDRIRSMASRSGPTASSRWPKLLSVLPITWFRKSSISRLLRHPALAQTVFLPHKLIGKAADNRLHVARAVVLRAKDEGSRPTEVERYQRAQELIPGQHPAMVGEGKVVDDPYPERVREVEAVGRSIQGHDLVAGLRVVDERPTPREGPAPLRE